MRQWPSDATVAHLIFVDHLVVPTSDTVGAAIEHARRKGARVIRTSALFPRATDVLAAIGFEPIDRLALLRLAVDDVVEHLPAAGRRSTSMLPWHHHHAARVDREAFGLMWGNDATSLRQIRTATPAHRARVLRVDGRIAGFAISGLAGSNGYVQRLAVAPEHRRAGIARELTVDAVWWMHARRATTAFVNTGVTNTAALALYDGLGFERTDDELTIAELRLTG
jgi:ribosomal-protein-alanine N-acetyltransferase